MGRYEDQRVDPQHLHRNWVGLEDFEQIVLITVHMVYLLSHWFRIDFYIDLAKNSVV